MNVILDIRMYLLLYIPFQIKSISILILQLLFMNPSAKCGTNSLIMAA
jgi:hypothetical protein